MKKFSLTLILAILSACGAFLYAGPEPISSGKEMKEVVQPMPPPCPTFGGFYIGITGGYKFGDVDIDMDLADDFPQGPEAAAIVEDHGEPDLSSSGAELGGVIGYNFQLHNNWVFGLEVAGGYLWLRDSEDTERFLAPDDNEFHVETSFKTHYLVTVGPRIGYAFCRWMPYITGGLALGDLDFHQRIHRHETQTHGTLDEGGSVDDTNAGWMVGGGLEYALTNHWRARVQYQYIDLGDVDFDHDSTEVDFSPGSSQLELREHNASFSLIYGF